jgi:hypothetical protein
VYPLCKGGSANFRFTLNATEAVVEPQLRLDPLSAHRYYFDMVRALQERTARAHWEHYLWLAACYEALGEQSMACDPGEQALALRPRLSIAAYVESEWRPKANQCQGRNGGPLAHIPGSLS